MTDHLKNAAYGWASNAVAVTVCSPLEVIRTQAQITAADKSHSIFRLAKDVYRKHSDIVISQYLIKCIIGV